MLFGGFAEARWPGVRLRTEVRYLIMGDPCKQKAASSQTSLPSFLSHSSISHSAISSPRICTTWRDISSWFTETKDYLGFRHACGRDCCRILNNKRDV